MNKKSLKQNKTIWLVLLVCVMGFFVVCDEARALSLETRIADNYTDVVAGGKVFFDVEIKYPENTRRRDLRIRYQMFDNDRIIATEDVLRAVETQASFIDYMTVPSDATEGIKTLNIIIKTYEPVEQGGVDEEVSATFRVKKGMGIVYIYFWIILTATMFVVILIAFQVNRFRRLVKAHRVVDV